VGRYEPVKLLVKPVFNLVNFAISLRISGFFWGKSKNKPKKLFKKKTNKQNKNKKILKKRPKKI